MHRPKAAARVAALSLAAAWVTGMALPPVASAQTLTIAASAPITSIDPHYHTYSPNQSLDSHLFEMLVDMDPASRPIPSLAVSWKLLGDTTWELKLRPGVKFHNGADFTAEDVAYSLARPPTVPNSPGSYAIYVKSITKVEIIDPLTVHLHTAAIYPLLPVDLTQVAILPHGLGANALTEDFNNGKNAIGTGPFRFVSYRSGDRIEMDRYDGYWGKKPDWSHVSYRIIPNDAARTAGLLSGDVDFIEAVPTSDATHLASDKRVHLAEVVSLRIIFLALDQSRADSTPFVTGPNGEKLDRNPLRDPRVRKALSIAINRPAIVERVMEGAAIPSGQFLPPGSYSYVTDLPAPAFDPARAKALLAEAGFPNGLRITLHGPNDRYVNDAKIIQSIGQMWSRIGVQTAVDGITWASYVGRANKQEFSAFLLGWGSASGEASSTLRSQLATFNAARGLGAVNRGRYSNPQLDALLDRAVNTGDDAAREKMLIDATRMAMDDTAFIPLHNQKNVWGMRANLTYAARADETSRGQDVHPVK